MDIEKLEEMIRRSAPVIKQTHLTLNELQDELTQLEVMIENNVNPEYIAYATQQFASRITELVSDFTEFYGDIS